MQKQMRSKDKQGSLLRTAQKTNKDVEEDSLNDRLQEGFLCKYVAFRREKRTCLNPVSDGVIDRHPLLWALGGQEMFQHRVVARTETDHFGVKWKKTHLATETSVNSAFDDPGENKDSGGAVGRCVGWWGYCSLDNGLVGGQSGGNGEVELCWKMIKINKVAQDFRWRTSVWSLNCYRMPGSQGWAK